METIFVLLSIKPEYAFKILKGGKKYEFRREPPRRAFQCLFIYASAPSKKIVAFARVSMVVEEEIEVLWEKYGPKGGIEKCAFESYFKGKRRGAVIVLSDVKEVSPAIDPYEVVPNFVPPQNYRYLNREESQVLTRIVLSMSR